MNDFENDQYTEQFTSFKFGQHSFNTIHLVGISKGEIIPTYCLMRLMNLHVYSQISMFKVHLIQKTLDQ